MQIYQKEIINEKVHIWCFIFSVKSAYPDEKGYVDKRQKELQDIWDALKVITNEHFWGLGLDIL